MARFLAATLLLLAAAADDPFEPLRTRARELMCWPSQVDATVAAAKAAAAALNRTCFWPDVDYNDPLDRADWRTFLHLGRTVTLIQAITAPGSPAFEDPALSTAAHCALDVWLAHGWVNQNW